MFLVNNKSNILWDTNFGQMQLSSIQEWVGKYFGISEDFGNFFQVFPFFSNFCDGSLGDH